MDFRDILYMSLYTEEEKHMFCLPTPAPTLDACPLALVMLIINTSFLKFRSWLMGQ